MHRKTWFKRKSHANMSCIRDCVLHFTWTVSPRAVLAPPRSTSTTLKNLLYQWGVIVIVAVNCCQHCSPTPSVYKTRRQLSDSTRQFTRSPLTTAAVCVLSVCVCLCTYVVRLSDMSSRLAVCQIHSVISCFSPTLWDMCNWSHHMDQLDEVVSIQWVYCRSIRQQGLVFIL